MVKLNIFTKYKGKKLKDVEKGIRSAEVKALKAYTVNIWSDARLNAPRRTGTLKRSIKAKVDEGTLTGTVFTNLKYSRMVEEGTRAHKIKARRVKALHFMWNGKPAFFKSVNHPGTRGQFYMRDAFDKWKDRIVDFFEVHIKSGI